MTTDPPFRPLTPREDPAAAFLCSLCRCRFTHGGQVCGACPVSAGCDLVKCPNCGFQFPRFSSIAESFTRVWRRWMERA